MWTAKNRGRYDRSALRYPSDLTDDEWAHVAPLIPPARRGGNKRHVDVREVMNGIMYVLSTGCQWRAIPKDLPARSTLYDYLDLWSWDGTLDRIHHALYVECREQGEREASPTAAIIDSQSVKSAEKGGLHRSAWLRCGKEDQGQEAPCSRRYARAAVERCRSFRQHPGSRRRHLCSTRRGLCSRSCGIFADAGYQGPRSARRCAESWVKLKSSSATNHAKICGAAQTMDRRAYHRMAQPMPKARQGLGEPQSQGARFLAPRINPSHAAKTLQSN